MSASFAVLLAAGRRMNPGRDWIIGIAGDESTQVMWSDLDAEPEPEPLWTVYEVSAAETEDWLAKRCVRLSYTYNAHFDDWRLDAETRDGAKLFGHGPTLHDARLSLIAHSSEVA